MPTGPGVSVLILIPTLRFAEAQGIASARLLAEVGLAESDLEILDHRVPYGVFEALTRKTLEWTGDSNLGLHMAEGMSAGSLGILGFVLMNCRTLGEALEKYRQYQRMVGDGIITEIQRMPGSWTVSFAFYPGCPSPNRHLMEGMMTGVVIMMAALAGKAIEPSSARFGWPHPGDDAEHKRIFRCPLAFDQPVHSLTFSETVIACRTVQPSKELLTLFETHTVEHLRKIDADLHYARKVREECARLILGEAPDIETVARKLAMSPRNLQLKLRQEGTSYREMLDSVRKDMAIGHLKNRQVTVSEVAYLLGFSEPSVFHRTFKRWTGSTPRDYRQAVLAG